MVGSELKDSGTRKMDWINLKIHTKFQLHTLKGKGNLVDLCLDEI